MELQYVAVFHIEGNMSFHILQKYVFFSKIRSTPPDKSDQFIRQNLIGSILNLFKLTFDPIFSIGSKVNSNNL